MALILSRLDIQRCLIMAEAIEAMRLAFSALHAGHVHLPQRLAVDLPGQGLALLMPSVLQTTDRHAFGLKVITVLPDNPLRGIPRSFASVFLLDATTGKTLAVLEGGWLTAMRTGAAWTTIRRRGDLLQVGWYSRTGSRGGITCVYESPSSLSNLPALPAAIHHLFSPTEEPTGRQAVDNNHG